MSSMGCGPEGPRASRETRRTERNGYRRRKNQDAVDLARELIRERGLRTWMCSAGTRGPLNCQGRRSIWHGATRAGQRAEPQQIVAEL